jgi:hypothetical protein
MSKFWKNLERAAILYAFGMNPMALRFMTPDEIRELFTFN